MVFQDSYASLDPRLTVEDTIAFGPRFTACGDGGAPRARSACIGSGSSRSASPGAIRTRFPAASDSASTSRAACALEPRLSHPRRGRLGPRQVGRSAGSQPPARSQGRVQPDLRVHLSRPQRRALHVGPRHGDVSRQGGRDRAVGVDLLRATPPLYAGAARLDAVDGSGPRTQEAPFAGDPPNPINPPPGCRFHPRCNLPRWAPTSSRAFDVDGGHLARLSPRQSDLRDTAGRV